MIQLRGEDTDVDVVDALLGKDVSLRIDRREGHERRLGPMGVGAVYNVLFSGAPAHNLGTSVPLTNGDNAGVSMGVASGTVMGPARHLTGAFTCWIGGLPASRMTSVALQNSTNCPGARVMPSQVTVLILAP